MACSTVIAKGIDAACKQTSGEILEELILQNKVDLDGVTYQTNVGDQSVLATVTNKTGKKGYKFQGKFRSIQGQDNAERGGQGDMNHTHQIVFVAYSLHPDDLKVLKDLKESRVYAYCEAGGYFWASGGIDVNLGYKVQSIVRDTTNLDNNGNYVITLVAEKVGSFWVQLGVWTGSAGSAVYDYQGSRDLFDGLLTVGA